MAALGEAFGARLAPGDLVVLTGDLGAGKTTMIRGIVKGAGSGARVRSPSFVRLIEYDGPVRICHFDLYRAEGADPAWADTLAEAAGDDAIALVEWGERIAAVLPDERFEVEIAFDGEGRLVGIRGTAGELEERLRGLAGRGSEVELG
jgi:tRNA threonylcarbamoyladenosine biosynthesis protein TsaE